MTDERPPAQPAGRRLRRCNRTPLFVDDLHARLAAELGFEALPRPADEACALPARPRVQASRRLGWLAVAALLVLALLALAACAAGTNAGRAAAAAEWLALVPTERPALVPAEWGAQPDRVDCAGDRRRRAQRWTTCGATDWSFTSRGPWTASRDCGCCSQTFPAWSCCRTFRACNSVRPGVRTVNGSPLPVTTRSSSGRIR